MTIGKGARRAGLLLGALLILGSAYLGCMILSGNLHTVVAGEFYRSAQVIPKRLETYQQLYGIRTIVNLRGANPQSTWYREEVAAARRHRIRAIPTFVIFSNGKETARISGSMDARAFTAWVRANS